MDTFARARDLFAAGIRASGPRTRFRARNTYVLRGSIYCGVCERRMQGQHSHAVAYYRCRFPKEYALASRVAHPGNVYLREDVLVEPLDDWLLQAPAPHRLEETVEAMKAGQHNDGAEARAAVARTAVRECEAKLTRYRAALDSGADPAVISRWIAQTQAQRALATMLPTMGPLRRSTAGPSARVRRRVSRTARHRTCGRSCQRRR